MIKTMKTLKWAAFLAVLSIVFVAFAMPNVFAGMGLGVSDYKLNVSVVVDSKANFAVARVYNVGDCDFMVSVVWIPEGDGVNVVVPEPLFLKIDESQKIYVDVEAKQLGVYRGTIEFVCEFVAQDGVSAVTPGGSTNVIFSVVDVVLPSIQEKDDSTPVIIVDDEKLPETIPSDDSLLPTQETSPKVVFDKNPTTKISLVPIISIAVLIVVIVVVLLIRKRTKSRRRYK